MKFAIQPLPHDEARRLITDKPAVSRDVFDALPDELKGRAFTITGIEDFDVLQAVRDEIAKLPAGADWDSVKKEIARKISPWFDPAAAMSRANLLLSHHGFAAYSAASARIMDSMTDIFPFRQYLSTGDTNVRASHAALDGIILPADHPFWEKHTPPWEWNCRCQAVELTEDDKDEEVKRDEKRDPSQRRVLGEVEQRMIGEGSLVRGPSQRVDVRTPKERGGNYEWSARDAALPYDQIADRWDATTREKFETWAKDIEVEEGKSLYSKISGVVEKIVRPKVKPAGALIPVVEENFSEAIARLGLSEKDTWTTADLGNLRAAMKKNGALQEKDLISSVRGTNKEGVLSAKEVRRAVQDLLDITPPDLARTLPKIRITIKESLGNASGQFYMDRKSGEGIVEISKRAFQGYQGEWRRREMRKTLSHELMHWLHREGKGTQADEYRRKIARHYLTRTKGTKIYASGKDLLREDKWWDLYAGKEYGWEKSPEGLEVPTRYFELWDKQEIITQHADPTQNVDAAAFRETFSLVHTIFDKP